METQSTTLCQARPPVETSHAIDQAVPSRLAERLRGERGLLDTLHFCMTFSPFLKDLIVRHDGFLADVANTAPETAVSSIIAALDAPHETQLGLRDALRTARQKLMLYLAIGDIGSALTLDTLTQDLSDLADAAIDASLRFELAQLKAKGRLDPEGAKTQSCGIGILGLGKLGGRELNYSSDIDVVAYFEPERFAYSGPKDKASAAITLVRNVFGHISARTAQGFVFRVDLRLRPNPSSTPIVMTLDAAETYYQTQGLTWERAALIKARHCAGDPAVTDEFLSRIRPFIWRKHLDFAAIDDVHAMKQRVHDHHNHDDTVAPCPGYDVKLGYGGIREIEFFAQIHQLISGGRRPDLRLRATCDVLRALRDGGDISADAYDSLVAAYAFLRSTEHRLQMVQDEQRHCLPETDQEVTAIANALGLGGANALFDTLKTHTDVVSQQFDAILKDRDETVTSINTAALPDKMQAVLKRWNTGHYRALSSARAQTLLKRVLPDLLFAFSQTPDPGETALVFDAFVGQLPSGVQIFSLLEANRPLIPLMANIMGQSPELSGQLTRRPALFEGLINEPLQQPMSLLDGLADDLEIGLRGTTDFESVLDLLRIWNGEARFQVGVRLLEGLASPQETRRAYSDIAHVTLMRLLKAVEIDFARIHGRIEGGELGILALGSFGAAELITGSDLDLTFIYRAAASAKQSDGARALPLNTYFARLAQRVITGLTSLTGEGRLYEVDMRLRPSGRSGIIAVSLDAFSTYHKRDAWLWERMSLTKARYIAGPVALAEAFAAMRQDVLQQPVSKQRVREALWSMRQKLRDAAPNVQDEWSLKGGDGGLTDADFLVEGLALATGVSGAHTHRWEQWWDLVGPHDQQDITQARALLIDARTVLSLLLPISMAPQTAMAPARAKLAALLSFKDFAEASDAIKTARQHIFTGLTDLLPPPRDTP